MSVQKTDFEFNGPYLGPTGIVFGLPLTCYALALLVCTTDLARLKEVWDKAELFSRFGFLVVISYFLAVLGLHLLLPAKTVEGVALTDKSRLKYRLNGLAVFAIVYPAALCLGFCTDWVDLSSVHDHWLSCLSGSVLLSGGLSVYLFCTSFGNGAKLAEGGQTGYHWYDFFMGRELNPRLGALDLKEFCELYPGLIGWTLLNLCNCHKQLETFGYLTNSMLLVNAFQLVYVVDALYFEPSILTTMDITKDGFGFMLAFGDLTWVPFVYALQSKYLAHHPIELPVWSAVLISCLNFVGYCIFRGANSQKDLFRRDPHHPSVAHLKTLKTARGRRLIVSGWWGLARHINYTGDWMMGLAWCLTCGFGSPVPYFYAIYFGVLLVHRDRRDEELCKQKYGTDWDKYCALVPYRLVPYLY